VWADGREGSDSVTVNIYRTKTALQGSDLTAKTELVTSVVLNKDNSWSYTYPNAATYGFDFTEFKAYYFDYYVEEVGVDGYEASYSYSGGGECVPIKLETDGQSHIVYTASANVTITNTKIIPKVTVTKSFEDGNDNHSDEQVSVGLYAKIMQEWSDYLETESGVEAVTSYRTSYLLCDTAVLNKDNNWTVTWELNDIGVAYDTTWEKYTVDSYFVAELAHTNISSGESVSGYEPVVYSVGEDGELTRTVISETLNTYDYYYTLSGTPSYTDQDGNIHISKEVSSLTMNIPTQNIDLYPVSTNVVIDNVPTSQLTVNKKWADGTVPTAVKVQLFPVEYVSDSQGNTTYIPIDASRTDITGVQWEVTLSAENNWTYHWDNLPSTYSPAIYNELIGRYVKIKYCVRELAADSDVEKLTELIYTPVYTDGDGISLEGEAAIGDRTDERNLCVMRPADGIINITNELKTGKLTVIKTWNGIAESDKTSVTMNIYRQQYDIEHKQAENTPELIDSVVLSAENGWSTTLNDLPCFLVDSDGTVHSYDYFISELAGEGYSVTYTYSDSEEALTKRSFDSIDTSLYQIGFLADKQSYSVTVTNSEQYSLPHSGGIGTHLYTISGATILLIASLLYIAIKKRHRRRDKGGAY
jgi:LPXTG-motif cell wall-anchored protein